MTYGINLLIAISDEQVSRAIEQQLANKPYHIWVATNKATIIDRLTSSAVDVAVLDDDLPGIHSLDILRQVDESQAAIISLIDQSRPELAVEALKLGTYAYLLKEPEGKYITSLPELIEHALKQKTEQETSRRTEIILRRQAAQFALIDEIGSQVGAIREMNKVLTQTAALLHEKFNYHHVALYMLEDDLLVLKAIAGIYEPFMSIDQAQHLSDGIIGWVATHGEKRVIHNVDQEPLFIPVIGEHTLTRSDLCLPIKIGGAVLGVIDIQSTQANDFNESLIIPMETLAGTIAVAIENARLNEAVNRELHDQRQAEKTIQTAYQRLSLYVENSPLMMIEWDQTFRITHWSYKAEAFFGWAAQEVMGKHPLDWAFVDQRHRAAFKGKISELLEGAEESNFGVFRHYTKHGQTKYCEWYNSVVYNESDNLTSLISLVLDVTEARQTMVDLRESEQRFRRVISSISDHIYMGVAGLNEDTYTTVYTSPNVENLTGHPHRKFIKWSYWQTLIHPDDIKIATTKFTEYGKNNEVEYRMQHADGSIIWVRDSRRIELEYDPETQTKRQYVYGVVHDITHRKNVEVALTEERALLAKRVEERTAELRTANAELAKAARLKDDFLASMSHELRTPLNAILGKSELMQEGLYGPVTESQLKSLKTIEESGRHLLLLINDILDISKIEAGKLTLEIHPVAPQWICEAGLRMIREMALKKGIQVEFHLDPNVETILADGRRLKQILVNLLDNAVKFTPEGGKIGLEVKGDAENEVVHFAVWDNGIGILPEGVKRLFEPFVQLDSSLARQYVGTGLGLSLVYRMTKLHGGGVAVESTPNQGSCFTVSLPWSLDQNQPQASESLNHTEQPHDTSLVEQDDDDSLAFPASFLPNPAVLVVEDNETHINLLTDFLPRKGFTISVVRNGQDAINHILTQKPDLILMDIQLPGMDGLQTTRHIRGLPEHQITPIIATTGLAMPGDKERCLEAGVTEYLSKPISLKKLVKVMQTHLSLKE